MGILDDAIRQHLDLKRLHGAEDSEVKRLEDEAFGPPTRPGEPDFPESQEQAAVATEAKPETDQPAGEEPDDDASGEAATTLLGAETAAPAEEAPAESAPAEEAPAAPEPPAAPPEPEPPAIEQPALGSETAEPAAAEEPPAAADPQGDDGAAFFDQAAGELDLDDLDLDLEDDETAEPADDEDAAAPSPEPPPSDEHPVAGLETEEHPMEELLDEPPATGEEPAPEAPAEPEPEGEGEGEEDEGDDEDVLEKTPEFLRESPEDDELWFEQGEPKDFDFD